MSKAEEGRLGSIASIWRYPVKSMLGEELPLIDVTSRGLPGDRAFALVDTSDGKVATAKNPRKWPTMFNFRALFQDASGGAQAGVRVTLPDGTVVASGQPDVDQILSRSVQRDVKLCPSFDQRCAAEAYWPDIEGLDRRDTVTEFDLPKGTFFDCAFVHLLTTATLARLETFHPEGRFEVPRFRPNFVIESPPGEAGFVENGWVGRVIAVGESVRLSIDRPCFRCVMTTLPQGDLPQDRGILRTIAQHNQSSVGVYASVLQAGTVRRGDVVRFQA